MIASLTRQLIEWLIAAFAYIRGRQDLALLAAVIVLATAAWTFTELVEAIDEREVRNVETQILLAFRVPNDPSDPLGDIAVEEAVRDLTALGGLLVTSLVTLLCAGGFVLARRARTAGFLIGSVASGVALTFLLKAGVGRVRPDIVTHQMEALSASFPSGHAATAAVVYLTLGAIAAQAASGRLLRTYIVGIAVALTLAIGASRLYLGVHWPTDVLAGWVVGAGWAIAAQLVARHFRQRGWIER